jgi:hypothetical protein
MKKSKSKYWKGKPRPVRGARVARQSGCLPDKSAGGKVSAR